MIDVGIIRPARMSERKVLEALQLRASLNNAGDREHLLAHSDAIELPSEQIAAGCVFVLERNGVAVGFAAIVPREDGGTELDGLFVEPDIWRSGIGRSLVEHCAERARASGSNALHVVGNPHAEVFYIACGFEMIGSVTTRFGVALSMRRML